MTDSKLTEAAYQFVQFMKEALHRAGRKSSHSEIAQVLGTHCNQVGLAERRKGMTGYDLLARWASAFRDAGLGDAVLTVDKDGPHFTFTFPDGSSPVPPPALDEPPEEKATRLEAAIRKHRSAQGQDLCWLNDVELWKALGDGVVPDRQVPPWPEFMAGCVAYRKMLEVPPAKVAYSPKEPADVVWVQEHHRDLWHWSSDSDGLEVLCGKQIPGSPAVSRKMDSWDPHGDKQCQACLRKMLDSPKKSS